MAETPECKICLCPLNEFPSEALLCGHAFHTECINEYVLSKGCSKENACSYKCKLKASRVDVMARENSLRTATNEEAIRASQAMADTSTQPIEDDEHIEQTGVDVI